MTTQKIELIARKITFVLVLATDGVAGYFMGHHFHSLIIGYVTYAVLISHDSLSIKLADICTALKGGR